MTRPLRPRDVSAEQALAFRVARHQLEERAPAKDLLRVVKRLVGVQSQVSSAAVKSIAARVAGASTEQVDALLHDSRKLARTWCMRCTLHVVHRDDYALLAAAVGVDVSGFKRWLVRNGMTDERYAEIRDGVLDALGDAALSRGELEERVKDRLHGTAELFGSWGGIMKILALEGHVVIGPRRAQETTFVRTDHWWGERVALPERAGALAALLRRHLGLYGPASLRDFTYWAGVPAGLAKTALAALGEEVVTVTVEGRPLLLLREDLRALERTAPSTSVRLLPNFDTYLLGHRDKELLLDTKRRKEVFRIAGWVSPTVLVGGRVAGVWELRRDGPELEVEVRPFARLSRSVWQAVRDEAALLEPRARVRRA